MLPNQSLKLILRLVRWCGLAQDKLCKRDRGLKNVSSVAKRGDNIRFVKRSVPTKNIGMLKTHNSQT